MANAVVVIPALEVATVRALEVVMDVQVVVTLLLVSTCKSPCLKDGLYLL